MRKGEESEKGYYSPSSVKKEVRVSTELGGCRNESVKYTTKICNSPPRKNDKIGVENIC